MAGVGSTEAGKTNRMGGMSFVRETSSTMRPACKTRRRIVPVTSEWKSEEYKACSGGGSAALGGLGSGVFRRAVWMGIDVACDGGNSADSCPDTSTPLSIEKYELERV